MSQEWSVIIPVKRLERAKSRLGTDLARWRIRLAEAFALDTIDAVVACPMVDTVIVVTSDAAIRAATTPKIAVVPDPREDDLDAAIRAGTASVRQDRPCATLTADLPALRTAELAEALLAAAEIDAAAFVADAEGTGTTMLAASSPASLQPRFGPGSANRHRAAGAVALDSDGWPGLRRDVDVPAHLSSIRDLGAGARTTLVLAALDRSHRYGG